MSINILYRLLWRVVAVLFVAAGLGAMLVCSAGSDVRTVRGNVGGGMVFIAVMVMMVLGPVLMVISARLGWKRFRREVLGLDEFDEHQGLYRASVAERNSGEGNSTDTDHSRG